MATTRLMPVHANNTRTITDCIDYVNNPDKTDKGNLVTSYECDHRTADMQFLLSKKQYAAITNRNQGKSDVLAYHTRQAFRPGEITPEEANRIGYELALKITKGNHQFIVATHIDKAHVHNHIIFNSTTLDCTRKFRNFWGSAKAVRRISDQLCVENGLSIIENPKPSKGHYGTWLAEDKPLSWKEKLRFSIDKVFEEPPKDLQEFIRKMKDYGYEVKEGKYLAFKAPEQKRFTRLRSLKGDYTDEGIMARVEDKATVTSIEKVQIVVEKTITLFDSPKINLLIDLQNNIKAKNSLNYEQWSKVFNLKQAAQTLIYLQENELTDYETLKEKTTKAKKNFDQLNAQIKEKENRLNEISSLQKHISNYIRTRDLYVGYRKSGYSKKYYAEHEGEIILHKNAKKAFETLGLKKLPTVKTLQTEYATVLAEKKKLYSSYRKAKTEMQDLLTAKSNTDRLLNYTDPHPSKKKIFQRTDILRT